MKVLFLVLVYVFNCDLFEFLAAILEKGLLCESIGNPGSLCVTRDITRVNYREHMRQSLGLKIC